MNRTEIIEKIIERFKCEPYEAPLSILKQILSEELPDFQRIDEERFKRIYASKVCDIGLHITEYNSTLPPALVPLPKDMPKYFFRQHSANDADDLWEWLLEHYGTPANNLQPLPKEMPQGFMQGYNSLERSSWWGWLQSNYGTPEPKPELPTVEELEQDILGIMKMYITDEAKSYNVSKHLHDKYALHTREWWQDLKKGDKFMYAGQVYEYYGYEVNHRCEVTLWGKSTWKFRLSGCTPYTPPSAQDIIAEHNLSEEEVKAIREGK